MIRACAKDFRKLSILPQQRERGAQMKLMKAAQFRTSGYFAPGSEPDLASIRTNVVQGIWPGTATKGLVYVDVDAFEALVRSTKLKAPPAAPFNPTYRR